MVAPLPRSYASRVCIVCAPSFAVNSYRIFFSMYQLSDSISVCRMRTFFNMADRGLDDFTLQLLSADKFSNRDQK